MGTYSGNCNNNNVLGNNVNSFSNSNLINGTVGIAVENGNNSNNANNSNTAVLITNTTPFNNGEALNTNINNGNNSCNLNNNVANLNDNVLSNFNNNSYNCNNNVSNLNENTLSNFNNNNSCNCSNNSCNCNNNSCNCSGNNSCNCSRNNSCGCNNNSCGCNCNGNNSNNNNSNTNNNNDSDNVTNNNLQENLRNFIGRRVTLEFNICGNSSKKTGVLSCVGRNFVTIRGINNNNCLICDTAGLNFVTVHNCG